MESPRSVYRVKVDASGRILLPAETRERRHIGNGDTVIVVEDAQGLQIKTREQLLVDAQAHFAKFVPRGVLLSDEVNEDRRAEHERD